MRHHVARVGEWLATYYETTRSMLASARASEMESRQLREEWGNALRQLAIANERLAALRDAAEHARNSKATFVAEVSHEFRTPLNIIIGMVSLMVEAPEIYDGQFPPHAMEQLRIVYDNSQHLAAMIDDVLDLSRVEAGGMTLHRELADVGEIVRATLSAVRPLTAEKGLALEVHVADNLPAIECDATRIRQVVLNLLSNAARLTDEGGIEVRVELHGPSVRISVADTGPGIAPEDSDRIFEPFRQGASSAWRDSKGTGLGLSLSRTFVQLHGGRMWFESVPGEGTTFFIDLPASRASGHRSRPDRWIRDDWIWREHSFHTESVGAGVVASGQRVLVVDESGGLAPELARYADEAHFVFAAGLHEAAIELESCPAHVAILNSASAEGIVPFIEAARQRMPDTPVVGCCCPPRSVRSRAKGAIEYLVKPVLRTDLAQALASAPRPVRRVLVVDDEPPARDLLASYLVAIDGAIDVKLAEGGQEALQAMRELRPDLVLLDVLMPELGGWDVLSIKESDPTIRDIPVVMVSAQDAREAPASTPYLVAALGQGVPVPELLACSARLSATMLRAG
jgi:signal transduction histidine kinase/CheY-like chemotaxis protein